MTVCRIYNHKLPPNSGRKQQLSGLPGNFCDDQYLRGSGARIFSKITKGWCKRKFRMAGAVRLCIPWWRLRLHISCDCQVKPHKKTAICKSQNFGSPSGVLWQECNVISLKKSRYAFSRRLISVGELAYHNTCSASILRKSRRLFLCLRGLTILRYINSLYSV